MKETPSVGRRNRKWAMAAVKGGHCSRCKERVTNGNIESYHFHHLAAVGDSFDQSQRWGGAVCDWPPFTEKWFKWSRGVDLICRDCHEKEHRSSSKQLEINWDAQARIDDAVGGFNNVLPLKVVK